MQARIQQLLFIKFPVFLLITSLTLTTFAFTGTAKAAEIEDGKCFTVRTSGRTLDPAATNFTETACRGTDDPGSGCIIYQTYFDSVLGGDAQDKHFIADCTADTPADDPTAQPGTTTQPDTPTTEQPVYLQTDCQGDNLQANLPETDPNHCGILNYLVITINILSVLAGIAIAAGIIIGGIQYSTAGSDPQKTAAAKARIRNAILALFFFIFGYALLNFLVPGGVL